MCSTQHYITLLTGEINRHSYDFPDFGAFEFFVGLWISAVEFGCLKGVSIDTRLP